MAFRAVPRSWPVHRLKTFRLRNFCFGRESEVVEGCLLEQQIEATRIQLSDSRSLKSANGLRLSMASLTTSLIQGICLFAVGINWAKAFLGITSIAASGGSSFIHSDPVRYALRYVSAVLATATLWVIWNGWRLRNRSSARWRKVPLSSSEKWNIALGLASSILSWVFIIAEVFAHQKMHPR